MPTFECPNCQIEVQMGDRFCEGCGIALVTVGSEQSCPKCQAPNSAIDADGFCGQCGFRVSSSSPEATDRVEMSLSSILAGVSDRGLVHFRNEDAIALESLQGSHILVVCDGVSSSHNPHLAAQTAAQTICQVMGDRISACVPRSNTLWEAMLAAQAAVSTLADSVQSSEDAPPDNSPSTTAVVALVQEDTATIGWVGDSRAYWVPVVRGATSENSGVAFNPVAQQLTEDDSWLNAQIRSGQPLPTEAQQSLQAHAITKWLGADAPDFTPSIMTVRLPLPGYLVLCSDGLWNELRDATHLSQLIFSITQSIASSLPPSSPDSITNVPQTRDATDAFAASNVVSDSKTNASEIAHHLVEYARSQGGHDNITVAILIVNQ